MKDLKALFTGVGIFILGFIIAGTLSTIFSGNNPERSYYYIIFFSILYLSAVVTTLGIKILEEIRSDDNK